MAQAAKIMLVEDDNNLGEIYEARMAAEGYSVVVAHDGEEALALAAKEKPDLIISDVMMPKISGFEMLDILRNTPGLKDTKVIMLTALGQAEDKTRADSLGADRYLVKSQVTLEDIVDNARALLGDGSAAPALPVAPQAPAAMPAAAPAPALAPSAPTDSIPFVTPASQPPSVSPIPVAAPPAGLEQPGLPPASVTSPADPLPTPAAVPTEPQSATNTSLAQPLQAAAPPAVPMPTTATPNPTPPSTPQVPEPVTVITSPAVPAESPNDKLLSGAVNELLANTQQPQPAIQAPSAAIPPEPAVKSSEPPQQAASDQAEESAANNKAPGDNSAQIARKKIIKPISDNLAQKPDINSLLAAEEGKESAAQAASITSGINGIQTTVVMPSGQSATDAAPAAAGQPGNVFSPTGDTGKANNNGIDPNSIAL